MALTLKQQAIQGFDARTNGRPSIGPGQITETLRPVAKPAEAFVQAAPAETFSATGELAKSLGALGGQLQGLVADGQRRAKADEEETQRAAAERAYIENNGQGFTEAVREGKIPAQASPIFRRTYQEQQGATLGRTGAAEIEQEYDKWEKRDTATPEEFTGWMAERVKERFANADPFALRAALPHIQRLQDRLSSRNVKEVSDRFYSGAIETAQREVRAVIDQELKEPDANSVGPFLPPQINATRAARTIDGITGRLKAAGVRGADLNAAVVDTITEEAVRRNDPMLLEVLKRDRENGTPGPGLTTYGQKKLAEAEDRIYRNVERLETSAARRQEREFKQGNRLATRHVVDTLFKNPEAEIDQNIIELGSRHDPDFAMKVEKVREQIQKRNETDTPSEVRDATRRIWESDRPTAAVMDEVANGNIKNPATMRGLLNDAARIEQARGRGGGSNNLDAFKRTREAIAKATDPYNTNSRDPDQINSRAVFDFELAMAEWDQRNPEATAVERMKQIKEVGDVYLGAISKDTGEYKPPDMAARTRTQADSQATQDGQRRLTRPAPQLQGETPRSTPQSAVQWMQSEIGQRMANLPAETRTIGGRTIMDLASGARGGGTTHLKLAEEYLGATERGDTAALSEFFRRSAGTNIDPRKTAWCAAFANAVLGGAGFGTTGSLMARSFLNYGEDATAAPQKGDVVVLTRGSGNVSGHVGFFVGFTERGGQRFIQVLGGNQSNGVNIQEYSEERLLGIRRPTAL